MIRAIQRVRSHHGWTGMLVLLGSGMGLLASFMLSLEAYWRALNPTQVFSCDVNAKLSCSSVAASWQSTLLHWPGGGAIPNAFLGLGIFAVFVTIGVFIASHATIPEWILWGFRLGVVAELVFSTWLLWESMFVIGAMCPWCLTMDLGSILLAFGAFRDWALAKGDRHPRALRFTIGMESLLVSVLILLAFAFIVVLHYFGSI